MTMKDFLKQYAEKFPDKISFGDVNTFINETNEITFDYADGLIIFFHHGVNAQTLEDFCIVTGSGGNNGCMFEEPDYMFVWEKVLYNEPKFMDFINEHYLGYDSLMTVIIRWHLDNEVQEIGNEDIECNFSFYEGKDY